MSDAKQIRLWVCADPVNGEGCEAGEPCEDGNCGWKEYARLPALLAAYRLTCAECEAWSDDEHPTKSPQWHAGNYYCSAGCVRKRKARQAKLRRAKRDWHACLARAGLAGHKTDYWGFCGDGNDPHYYPTGRVHTPTFALTLRLGAECDVAANLSQWHAATGLPIPPVGQMPQAQWMAMLRDWLNSSGVGRAEVVRWHDAEHALGLGERWQAKALAEMAGEA